MKKYIDIFCTPDFLINFYAQKPDIEDESEKVEHWRSFLRFLKNHVNITLEVSKTQLHELLKSDNPIFRSIADQWMQSSAQLLENFEATLEDKNALEEGAACKLFFTHDEEKVATAKEEKLGIPFITNANFSSRWGFLSQVTPLKIHKKARGKDALNNWKDLSSLVLSSNSILICDNYVLSNSYDVQNNLFKILKVLLPEKDIKKTIDITIVTGKIYWKMSQVGQPKNMEEESIEQVYLRIQEYIREGIGLSNFNLTLIKKELSKYHDRQIFTNTCVLEAGNSFNFFSQYGDVRLHNITDIKVIPLTAEKQDREQKRVTYAQYYQDHLRVISRIVKEAEGVASFQGSKENRLLAF